MIPKRAGSKITIKTGKRKNKIPISKIRKAVKQVYNNMMSNKEKKKTYKDLTLDEGKEILKFVFPNQKDYYFTGIDYEPIRNTSGGYQLSFSDGGLIYGIRFHNGQDNCLLRFNHPRVIMWLYDHDFDIKELLELNKNDHEEIGIMDSFVFKVNFLSKKEIYVKPGFEDKYTLDYVTNTIQKYMQEYYNDLDKLD